MSVDLNQRQLIQKNNRSRKSIKKLIEKLIEHEESNK